MKFVGLISGGKDSLFAIGKALSMGHTLLCTANLFSGSEADSYMFQTTGTLLAPAVSSSLGVPLVSRELLGKSLCKDLTYSITDKDEIEDLYELLMEAKFRFPDLNAVVSGAVFSDYQRSRVENVCLRLGLTSISPLWRMNQKDLLLEMKETGYHAAIIKISSMGLQEKHLGCEVSELIEYFEGLQGKFGFHMAGEGGEYETLILDAPILQKKLILAETDKVVTGNSTYSPYGHLIVKKLMLEDKTSGATEEFIPSTRPHPKLFRRHGEYFIGEITAASLGQECTSFEHEAFCVLKGLKEILESNDLSLRNIYYLTAYIKDMRDYLSFNAVYSKFFSFPSPPARVCCELSAQDCRVKVSVRATISKKKCTHVQSISAWAPASIGPYSQAYGLNLALHLAGSIPLIPQSMTLSPRSLEQIIENCEAVASVNGFNLQQSEMCVVYYTTEMIQVPESYSPLYVQVSGLPKNAPLEIEFHLQQSLPLVEKGIEDLDMAWGKARAVKRNSMELVYAHWQFVIERIEDYGGFVESMGEQLTAWFDQVKHKSGIDKEQLLGVEDIVVGFTDYVTEIRVFAPEPYLFKTGWLHDVPVIYLHSTTTAVYIQLQDFLQITTYQFINSGN